MKWDEGEIEIYLSGYLDGELTQQHRQRVEVALESDPAYRRTLEELREAKEAAARLEVDRPSTREWELMMSDVLERRTQHLGWLIVILWSAALALYGLYHYATAPGEPLVQKVLFFGLLAGFVLLFVSVLARRLRESRTDRYKGIVK